MTLKGLGRANIIGGPVRHKIKAIFYPTAPQWNIGVLTALTKGQLNSEWIYEVIVSPKMQTKNYKDFCLTKQTRIVAPFFGDFWWV